MAGSPWGRYLDLAGGIVAVPRRTAEAVVQRLVQQGEVAAERAEHVVDDLLARSERNRGAIAEVVTAEVERVVDRLGLARQADLDRLERRVDALAREVDEARAAADRASPDGNAGS
ncbi:hypothetical protein ER308_19750 [Egibacter rhizosphaerae]|uniref:Polyhydroxyalkanoate synthesis regulator n=1 Tax=Egibacter rhizosphaerae TaxID=1670831 RepID=A0A411YK73_9ACTN|nr:phasin family protein [Egibacter rhizosphaerae]QBI21581.1 hypothetical protein ER308_19750 [Egibacter rhizosphaerae]